MAREVGEIAKNLKAAVNLHCRECADIWKNWNADNDCQVFKCHLYPYRPGTGGDERKVRVKSAARVAAAKARFGKIATLVVDVSSQTTPAHTPVAPKAKTRAKRRIRDANGNLVPRASITAHGD